jgi:hypothetical protein
MLRRPKHSKIEVVAPKEEEEEEEEEEAVDLVATAQRAAVPDSKLRRIL